MSVLIGESLLRWGFCDTMGTQFNLPPLFWGGFLVGKKWASF